MDNLHTYTEQFFTFNNPLFFGIILSTVILTVVILIFVKVIMPMQKKFIQESQRYLLEKAELMALFAEMDPHPLIRINASGDIIQTNEASRNLFPGIETQGKKIWEFVTAIKNFDDIDNLTFSAEIHSHIFSVIVKKSNNLKFANVYMHDITKLKEYERTLEVSQNRLRALANELDSKYEELKKSLSAELHDDIGQKLIIIKLKLSQPQKYDEAEIQSDLDVIYQRIREISRLLKPSEIGKLGLELSIKSLVHNVAESSGIHGSCEISNLDKKLDPKIENCIYHTVQEALNNVVKHSNATEFSVEARLKNNKIDVAISDDGVGLPEEYFRTKESLIYGTGLIAMRERIENCNGKLNIISNPNEGTCLIVQIPKAGRTNGKDTAAAC